MKSFHIFFALLLVGFVAHGCATVENQGKLVKENEVTKLIESATVLSGHTYYYTGPEALPDTIIAIDNHFTLQSKYWVKIDDVAERLNRWNRLIDNAHRIPGEQEGPWTLSPFYKGARILTQDGRQAGIWYSRHDNTVVQFPDPSTIILYTPSVSFERSHSFPSR